MRSGFLTALWKYEKPSFEAEFGRQSPGRLCAPDTRRIAAPALALIVGMTGNNRIRCLATDVTSQLMRCTSNAEEPLYPGPANVSHSVD